MKIDVTQEQYEFLKELQHELLTQPTDGQANPKFWGIMEKREVGVPDGCGDARIYMGDGVVYTLEEAIEDVNEWIESCYDPDGFIKQEWDGVNKEWMKDVADFIKDYVEPQCRIVWVDNKYELSTYTGAFLTKRACKDYIDKYGYNHSNPHTYAMTAIRNPEYETLINILETMKFDD